MMATTTSSELPTTPLIEFMSKQEAAMANISADENQDSFKGVEEFDMNVVPAADVFSDLFKGLEENEELEENKENIIEIPLPEPVVETKKVVSSTLKHVNQVFIDSTDPVDRSPAVEFRKKCRDQLHTGQTSGIAQGFVQANMVALPREHAADFLEFVKANPKGCPLLGMTKPGVTSVPTLAADTDLRTDLPKYRVWVDGVLTQEVSDATQYWTDDMVGFLLGCSFTWESVLKDAGYCPRHLEGVSGASSKTAPMYKTCVRNVKKGCFGGEVVVSMRPYPADQIEEVFKITARYPDAHGSPIHWGNPALLGIGADMEFEPGTSEFEKWSQILANPDFGDKIELREGDVPVFWACGVTSQMSLIDAKLPLVVTHAPGHMFICDITDYELIKDV